MRDTSAPGDGLPLAPTALMVVAETGSAERGRGMHRNVQGTDRPAEPRDRDLLDRRMSSATDGPRAGDRVAQIKPCPSPGALGAIGL